MVKFKIKTIDVEAEHRPNAFVINPCSSPTTKLSLCPFPLINE
jgi:hypothetical protein